MNKLFLPDAFANRGPGSRLDAPFFFTYMSLLVHLRPFSQLDIQHL